MQREYVVHESVNGFVNAYLLLFSFFVTVMLTRTSLRIQGKAKDMSFIVKAKARDVWFPYVKAKAKGSVFSRTFQGLLKFQGQGLSQTEGKAKDLAFITGAKAKDSHAVLTYEEIS